MERRELDGNCDGEEVFEILLYTAPQFCVRVVVCILGEQVIILHTPPLPPPPPPLSLLHSPPPLPLLQSSSTPPPPLPLCDDMVSVYVCVCV